MTEKLVDMEVNTGSKKEVNQEMNQEVNQEVNKMAVLEAGGLGKACGA